MAKGKKQIKKSLLSEKIQSGKEHTEQGPHVAEQTVEQVEQTEQLIDTVETTLKFTIPRRSLSRSPKHSSSLPRNIPSIPSRQASPQNPSSLFAQSQLQQASNLAIRRVSNSTRRGSATNIVNSYTSSLKYNSDVSDSEDKAVGIIVSEHLIDNKVPAVFGSVSHSLLGGK
jgi:hypothetical protein